jgi:hypothetical protein
LVDARFCSALNERLTSIVQDDQFTVDYRLVVHSGESRQDKGIVFLEVIVITGAQTDFTAALERNRTVPIEFQLV